MSPCYAGQLERIHWATTTFVPGVMPGPLHVDRPAAKMPG